MQEATKDSWERERLLEALEAFHQGAGDAPLLRKWSESMPDAGNTKTDGQRQPMAFVLSTDDVDRHGDVIVADGWKLDAYRSNPVFLWAHDYARPVIGRAVDTWMEPHRLMARVEFAPTQFAQEVAGLYQAGYQRGVSVGFKPLKYEERRHEKTGAFLGIKFLEQELLEVSAVPVPANRHALRRAINEAPRVADYLRRAGLPVTGGDSGAQEFLASLEAAWPLISARIDDLAKLAVELACSLTDLTPSGATTSPETKTETMVEGLLEALRELHSPVSPPAKKLQHL